VLFSNSYFTIKQSSEGTLREKGSKFLSFAFPVVSESEIKAHLSVLKKLHPSASHHCYAWRLGHDKSAYRSNDDGEPANTAGKPILSQIQSHDLTNVLLVVVRYFGGTLLGVGGLIQAYKQAAKLAIDQALIEERYIIFHYIVTFNFGEMNAVMKVLKEHDAKIISLDYDENNTINFRIKKQNSEKMEQKFNDLYNCKLKFVNSL